MLATKYAKIPAPNNNITTRNSVRKGPKPIQVYHYIHRYTLKVQSINIRCMLQNPNPLDRQYAIIKGKKDNPQKVSANPNTIPNKHNPVWINIANAVITGQYLNVISAHFLQSLSLIFQ